MNQALLSKARIQPAIDFFGSQAALARAIGKRQSHVSFWSRTRIPAEIAKQIEVCTHGAVSRYHMRPDIFDPPGREIATKE